MKKHSKVLKLIIFLVILFSTFVKTKVESFALNSQFPTVQTIAGTNQPEKHITKPSTIPEKNAYALTHMEKTGFKYTILKFLMAMLGVLVSALAILLGLKIYKKLIFKNDAKINNIDYDKTLESPRNFKEAINIFLNKTKK